jgi:multicomponent Na+:H+ antiporter subunit E
MVGTVFFAYFLLWVVLNGKVTLEIVLFGLGIALALTLFTCKITGHSFKTEMTRCFHGYRYVGYIGRLVIEIFKSGIQVIRFILNPEAEVHPMLVYFRTPLKSEGHQVLYANSITLTPGTITVGIKDGRYHVHALDRSFLPGIDDNRLIRTLSGLEAKYDGQ